MNNLNNIVLTGVVFFSIFPACQNHSKNEKLNVLFIAVDDLRPELNCYGKNQIISPNLDKLASEGVIFNRSYCNIPVCGASRASLLTSTRPTRNRFINYDTWIDKDNPDVPTLPEYFRNNGYYTIGNGKIAHHKGDGTGSWDEEWRPKGNTSSFRDYTITENQNIEKKYGRGPAYEINDVPDSAYRDGKLAVKAIADLRKLKQIDKPLFLGVGFLKPHLPFTAPKKYWDLYNYENIKLPENNYRSESAPKEAFHNFGELRNYYGIRKEGDLPDSLSKKLIHGYYASVSYVDAQIGRVLDELKSLGLDKNTVVILWGDHGWNLDEHGLWCKHCNFETSLRSTLMIKAPGIKTNEINQSIIEFIDIYPTLCELCNLELPEHLEGKSIVELLKNPNKIWNEVAVSKWFNGVTLIKDNYFYTEWSQSSDSIYAKMLYDHSVDPQENNNISELKQNTQLVDELSQSLHQNWGKDFDN